MGDALHFCLTGQYTPQALKNIMENPTTNRYEAAKKLTEAGGGLLGEIPIYQSSRVALSINLKTAKTLGTRISPSLLARADEVIE
jgi:hypothetical protein